METPEKVEVPASLQDFMHGLMKEARKESFIEFCEYYGVDYQKDYPQLVEWFDQFGVKL